MGAFIRLSSSSFLVFVLGQLFTTFSILSISIIGITTTTIIPAADAACPQIAASGTGIANVACSSTADGAICVTFCQTGFYQSANSISTYTCNNNQWEDGDIRCVRQDCGALAIANSNSSACPAGTLSFGGGSCVVACAPGFTQTGTIQMVFSCNASGAWSPSPSALTCQPVTCPALAIPANAASTCATGAFGAVCDLACKPGFVESVGSDSSYICAANRTWSGGNLLCEPVDCGAIAIANSNSSNCSSSASSTLTTTAGASCTVGCATGFNATNGNSAVQTFTCTPSGTWTPSPNTRSCSAVVCSALPAPANATAGCAAAPFGTVCDLTCLPGFVETASSDSSYVCGANRAWTASGSGLVCEPRSCGRLVVSNSDALTSCNSSKTLFGSTCSVQCAAGYVAQAPSTAPMSYSCNSSGLWQPTSSSAPSSGLTCVPRDCGVPTRSSTSAPGLDPLATVSCTSTLYGVQEGCTAFCPSGYYSDGNPSFTCQSNGLYTGQFMCRKTVTFLTTANAVFDSAQLVTSGGAAASVGTSLPTGVTLATGTGKLSGTNMIAGTYAGLQIQFQDGSGVSRVTDPFAITVLQPLVVSWPGSYTPPRFPPKNAQYITPAPAVTGGSAPYAFSLLQSASLGNSMFISASTGVVSGLPLASAVGEQQLTIVCTDSNGAVSFLQFGFSMVNNITVLVPANGQLVESLTDGWPFTALQFLLAGVNDADLPFYSYKVDLTQPGSGPLPNGLTITPAGLLSGTPMNNTDLTVGRKLFSSTIVVRDNRTGSTQNIVVNFNVSPRMNVTGGPARKTYANIGLPLVPRTFAAFGGRGTVTYSVVGNLPAGLTYSCLNGQITGIAEGFNISNPNVVESRGGARSLSYFVNVTAQDENDAIVTMGPFEIVVGTDDCQVHAYGPDGKGCSNGGKCVDPVPFDGSFTCDCAGGGEGSNCVSASS